MNATKNYNMTNRRLNLFLGIFFVILFVVAAFYFPKIIGISLFWGLIIFFISKSKWYKNKRNIIPNVYRIYFSVGTVFMTIVMLLLAFCVKEAWLSKNTAILLFVFAPIVIISFSGIICYIIHGKPKRSKAILQ